MVAALNWTEKSICTSLQLGVCSGRRARVVNLVSPYDIQDRRRGINTYLSSYATKQVLTSNSIFSSSCSACIGHASSILIDCANYKYILHTVHNGKAVLQGISFRLVVRKGYEKYKFFNSLYFSEVGVFDNTNEVVLINDFSELYENIWQKHHCIIVKVYN